MLSLLFNRTPLIIPLSCNYRCMHYQKYSVNTAKAFDDIPGLSSLPIIGPMHHFLPLIGSVGPSMNFYDLSQHLYQRFGNIVKLDGVFARAKMVLLFEPEYFEQIYRAEETNPLRPGFDSLTYYYEDLRKNVFDGVYGLTIAQGIKWREFRTKVNPVLLKPKLVKLYTPLLDEIAKDMTMRLIKLNDEGNYLQLNLDSEIMKWSLESIACIGLGTRLRCLQDDWDDYHPTKQLIKYAKDIMKLAYKLEFFPSPWRYVTTPSLKKMVETLDSQWEISEKYIMDAKKKIDERSYNIPDEDKSIIEKLLAIDENVAILMANEMLLAGIETVTFSTLGLLYNLAVNPIAQEKLREEIRSNQPNKPYFRGCVKESLRLYPVIPANLRRTSKPHVVAGYHIPTGIDVIAPNEFLSKLEKYYIRPTEFLPERWLVDKTDPLYYGNAHPMITMPFGFGVRTCIGRRIAELEMESFITTFLRDIKITWKGPPIKVVTKLMNAFQQPYNFKFELIV